MIDVLSGFHAGLALPSRSFSGREERRGESGGGEEGVSGVICLRGEEGLLRTRSIQYTALLRGRNRMIVASSFPTSKRKKKTFSNSSKETFFISRVSVFSFRRSPPDLWSGMMLGQADKMEQVR